MTNQTQKEEMRQPQTYSKEEQQQRNAMIQPTPKVESWREDLDEFLFNINELCLEFKYRGVTKTGILKYIEKKVSTLIAQAVTAERERILQIAEVCSECAKPRHIHPHDFYDNSLDCNCPTPTKRLTERGMTKTIDTTNWIPQTERHI